MRPMSRITVLGAGVCGLAAGLLLARDGHVVTLLERDPEAVPDSAEHAWERWARDGVTQFRQPHYLQPRGRAVLEEELPDVPEALAAAGACRFAMVGLMPPSISDRAPRPGDERFTTLTARRPILEQVLGQAARSQPGLEVRRGVAVKGLVTSSAGGVAHVTGVGTDDGDVIAGDLVVDAMGRGSALAGWVNDVAAAPVPDEAEDSGFIYYTRFFRAGPAGVPPYRSAPSTPVGSFSILVLPGDNDTWSVTLYSAAGDQPLKRLRQSERWEAVLAACPLHAQWLDGEPITGVLPMGGIVDRHRRLVADGRPLVTGVALLADAWACTNPSLGRGMTLGLLHAQLLRDAAHDTLGDPTSFAALWDETTETRLTPWYDDTVQLDRARLHEIDALRSGSPPPAPEGRGAAVRAAWQTALAHDADVFRAFLETRCGLTTTDDVLGRPGLGDRILELAVEHEPTPVPGPDREQLLALLSS
jgi:2-polyprenyl-6-methoxyphenol hydroxylase-like FAD-dependent oxidoreductase